MNKIASETMCKCEQMYGAHSKGGLKCPDSSPDSVGSYSNQTFSRAENKYISTSRDAMCYCGYSRGKHAEKNLNCPIGEGMFHKDSTFKWNGCYQLKDSDKKPDLGQQALEVCWQIGKLGACENQTKAEIMASALRASIIAQTKKQLKEAQNLAVSIWKQHYERERPDWKPLDDTIGVLTQISNMVSCMGRKDCSTCGWNTDKGLDGCGDCDIEDCLDYSKWVQTVYVENPTCVCNKSECPECTTKSRPMFDCCDSQSEPLDVSELVKEECKTPYGIAIKCLEDIANGHIQRFPKFIAQDTLKAIDKMTKITHEPTIKFGKETEEVVHKFEIECDDITEQIFIDYAKKRILNDKQALINYAVNEIIREEVERQENEQD